MKRFLLIIPLTLCFLFLFCGCGAKKTDHATGREEGVFRYGFTDCTAFAVDEEGFLYAAFGEESEVRKYDPSGEEVGSFSIGEGLHSKFWIDGETLYGFTYGDTEIYYSRVNLQTGETEKIMVRDNGDSILSMCVLGGEFYEIRWNSSAYGGNEEDPFSPCMGERAVKYDPGTGEISELSINGVLNMTGKDEHTLLFYCYDQGYYFIEYDIETGAYGERYYHNGMGNSFGLAAWGQEIFLADYETQRICMVERENILKKVDVLSRVVVLTGNDMQCHGDMFYVLDGQGKDVVRVSLLDAVRENPTLRVCMQEEFEEPYGCGYQMEKEWLEDEEFALRIMSGASDYDICMMSSGNAFSGQLCRQGAFYPLNDVPGVQDYISRCFPYLQEAAYDEAGNIWMIPFTVDVRYLLYNREYCRAHGIDMENMTLEGLYDTCRVLYENPEQRDKYTCNAYQLASETISQYHGIYTRQSEKIEYDTEDFRKICDLWNKNPLDADYLHTLLAPEIQQGWENHYFFEIQQYRPRLVGAFSQELHARALPSGVMEGRPVAKCYFICVNGNSTQLSTTLSYISSFCDYLMGQEDSFLLQDRDTYTCLDRELGEELYEIYGNALVDYTLPDEVFDRDMLEYLKGNLSQEQFIREISRKVNMYLEE